MCFKSTTWKTFGSESAIFPDETSKRKTTRRDVHPRAAAGFGFLFSGRRAQEHNVYILEQVFKKFITSPFGHDYTFYFIIWKDKNYSEAEAKRIFFCHLKMNVCQATFFIALNAIKVILTFLWIIYFKSLILQNLPGSSVKLSHLQPCIKYLKIKNVVWCK